MFSDFVVFKIFMQFFRIFIKKSKFCFPSIYFPMTLYKDSLLLFFLPHFCHKPVKVWDQSEILKPNIIRKLSKDKFMHWCNQKLTCNLTASNTCINKEDNCDFSGILNKNNFFSKSDIHRHLILTSVIIYSLSRGFFKRMFKSSLPFLYLLVFCHKIIWFCMMV